MVFELPDRGKAIDRIPGETADGLRDNEVDLSVERILDHVLEADSLFDAGAADSFVRVDIHELPVITGFDVVGVVVNLRLVACKLIVMVG